MTGLPAGYDIGLATQADCAGLPEIERRAASAFQGHPGLGASTIDLSVVTPLGFLQDCARTGLLWVATHHGAPVGFAACDWHDEDFFLAELNVDPDHGRKGLGRALLKEATAFGFAKGATRVTLTTFTEVPWNRPFYESEGFKVIPEAEWADWMRDSMAAQIDNGLDPAMRCFMGVESVAG